MYLTKLSRASPKPATQNLTQEVKGVSRMNKGKGGVWKKKTKTVYKQTGPVSKHHSHTFIALRHVTKTVLKSNRLNKGNIWTVC